MRNHKIALFILIFSAIVFVFPSNFQKAESRALNNELKKCAIPPFQTAFNQAKAIFAGEVLSVEKNSDTKTFEFMIEKSWKGENKRKIKINVYETPRYQAFFKKGEKYLIFADADEDGNFSVRRCSRSKAISEASEDLKLLGGAKRRVIIRTRSKNEKK